MSKVEPLASICQVGLFFFRNLCVRLQLFFSMCRQGLQCLYIRDYSIKHVQDNVDKFSLKTHLQKERLKDHTVNRR